MLFICYNLLKNLSNVTLNPFYLFYWLCVYSGEDGGMLIINVAFDSNQPGVPVVESSGRNSEPLTLQVDQQRKKNL